MDVDGRSQLSTARSMSVDGRTCLSTNGHNIVSPRKPRKSLPQMTSSDMAANTLTDMGMEEMQASIASPKQQLTQRHERDKESRSARGLLEANKQMILEKQERRVLARQNSREYANKLIDDDRRAQQAEALKEVGKRNARAELAQHYKSCIEEKRVAKANAYSEKLSHGTDVPFFPFTEGETIVSARQAQRSERRNDMQDFLRRQLEEHPPRPNFFESSAQIDDDSASAPTSPAAARTSADLIDANLSKAPHYLQKTVDSRSRRVQDGHVRAALEAQVKRKKEELEAEARRRLAEVEEQRQGMTVNDALRYDGDQWKRMELRRNADYVRYQIEEKHREADQKLQQQRAEPHGYWGPEEKPPEGRQKLNLLHENLIKQMEVDQSRRIAGRARNLEQERRLVNNGLAEIHQDRREENHKREQHREVLVTTWANQQLLRSVQDQIDSYT